MGLILFPPKVTISNFSQRQYLTNWTKFSSPFLFFEELIFAARHPSKKTPSAAHHKNTPSAAHCNHSGQAIGDNEQKQEKGFKGMSTMHIICCIIWQKVGKECLTGTVLLQQQTPVKTLNPPYAAATPEEETPTMEKKSRRRDSKVWKQCTFLLFYIDDSLSNAKGSLILLPSSLP